MFPILFSQLHQSLLPEAGIVGIEERLARFAHGPFDRGGGALALLADAKDLLKPVDRNGFTEQMARGQETIPDPTFHLE